MRTYVLRKAGLGNQTAWYSDALTEATQLGDPALSWQDGSQGWRPGGEDPTWPIFMGTMGAGPTASLLRAAYLLSILHSVPSWHSLLTEARVFDDINQVMLPLLKTFYSRGHIIKPKFTTMA